jgi:hypothetical protein
VELEACFVFCVGLLCCAYWHVVFLLNYVPGQIIKAICGHMYAILAVYITRVYECLLLRAYVCFSFVSILPPVKF